MKGSNVHDRDRAERSKLKFVTGRCRGLCMNDKRLTGTWNVMDADVVSVLARQMIAGWAQQKVDKVRKFTVLPRQEYIILVSVGKTPGYSNAKAQVTSCAQSRRAVAFIPCTSPHSMRAITITNHSSHFRHVFILSAKIPRISPCLRLAEGIV